MNERIINILLDSKRNYNAYYLKELKNIESYFKLKEIDITKLGNIIKDINNKASIKIIDTNHNIYYEYNSNDELDKIGNTVIKCKRSSIYPLIMYSIGFMDITYFEEEDILPICGGMPIYINNELKYIIEVNNSDDNMNIIIEALSKYLNIEIPKFTGQTF